MTAARCLLAIWLLALAPVGRAAEPGPSAIGQAAAEAIRTARLSAGFETRMSITVIDAQGQKAPPVRLAVVGKFEPTVSRIVIRGISPGSARQRAVAAESDASGHVRAVAFGERLQDGVTAMDPQSALFDTDLTVWDLLAPWWNWPRQVEAGGQPRSEPPCATIRSQQAPGGENVREVASCIASGTALSMHTELFDQHHAVIRTVVVQKVVRTDSGLVAPRQLLITKPGGSSTLVDIYSGDEHHALGPGTFAALDRVAASAHRESR
jgi:hypothetical protein